MPFVSNDTNPATDNLQQYARAIASGMSNSDTLNRIVTDLRSRSDDVKVRAVGELRDYVATVSREISGENFTKFNNDVNKRIFELIHSSDNNDKIGTNSLCYRL